VDKAHVQHAVGFIQDQHFQVIELHRVLLIQVQQASWCGHQHIATATQALHLRIDLHATEYHAGRQWQVLAVSGDAFRHLGGQLAGWREYQGADLIVARRCARAQALQKRQGKAGGFAGTGLGGGHHITAGQDGGNGLGLNRGRGVVATLSHGRLQGITQPEI